MNLVDDIPETHSVLRAAMLLMLAMADGSAVTAQSPIAPGETLSIYATGPGAVAVNLQIGAVAPSNTLATTDETPSVLLGNVLLAVAYSGLAPGFAGFYQVNVTVPFTWVSSGSQISVELTDGGQSARWQASQ